MKMMREQGPISAELNDVCFCPGSTLTGSDLQPCLVTSCKVVWNDL